MLTRTLLALVSLLFVVAGCASTDAVGGPGDPPPRSGADGSRKSFADFEKRTYSTFPLADIDWSANGTNAGSFAVEITWDGSDVTEVEVEYRTSIAARFQSAPTGLVTMVSGALPLRFDVPAPGPGDSGVCHLLVLVREKDVDGAPIHYAEFTGEERRSRRGCEVCYDTFHSVRSPAAAGRNAAPTPDGRVGQESAPLVAPLVAPQPQIGGTIGFKRFHTSKGERIGIDADATKVKLYAGHGVTVERAWLWISDEPVNPWQVRHAVTAALAGSRSFQDNLGKGLVLCGADLQFAAPTFRTDVERVHIYIVAQEKASKHPALFWRYWRTYPVDVSTLPPAGSNGHAPPPHDLENGDFHRVVSAATQLSVVDHDCR